MFKDYYNRGIRFAPESDIVEIHNIIYHQLQEYMLIVYIYSIKFKGGVPLIETHVYIVPYIFTGPVCTCACELPLSPAS